jgi:hypothetical protein
MIHTGQVTIPTPAVAVPLSATRTPCYEVIVQKNTANGIRVGDKTVTASIGLAVAASNAAPGPVYFGPYMALSIDLSTIFVFGTAGDVVDFAYVK